MHTPVAAVAFRARLGLYVAAHYIVAASA